MRMTGVAPKVGGVGAAGAVRAACSIRARKQPRVAAEVLGIGRPVDRLVGDRADLPASATFAVRNDLFLAAIFVADHLIRSADALFATSARSLSIASAVSASTLALGANGVRAAAGGAAAGNVANTAVLANLLWAITTSGRGGMVRDANTCATRAAVGRTIVWRRARRTKIGLAATFVNVTVDC